MTILKKLDPNYEGDAECTGGNCGKLSSEVEREQARADYEMHESPDVPEICDPAEENQCDSCQ